MEFLELPNGSKFIFLGEALTNESINIYHKLGIDTARKIQSGPWLEYPVKVATDARVCLIENCPLNTGNNTVYICMN